jgi:hypothetical protein
LKGIEKKVISPNQEKTMKNKLKLICVVLTLTYAMSACKATVSTGSNAAAPGNTASNANAKPAANTAAAPKVEKPKTEKLADEKKPEGKSTVASKSVKVPDNWIYIYNEQKGYGFYVPEGSTGGGEVVDGADVFVCTTPAPSDVAVFVFAFKDASLSKEDLLDHAEKILSEMGQTVQAGKLTGESDDYSVAEATLTDKADGSKSKAKVLVGTDVSDNYVMIVGTDEAKYAANEKIIDEIWGSFEMWSGGASGGN